ncbi:circadian clock-controlled protein daywake-like [Haematobia irritans]|uniref:circadian clock-controlled protein daywake-like n=1 Tax=Haematobia irritans TaxID=7368 RepID=UPI003F4FF4C4
MSGRKLFYTAFVIAFIQLIECSSQFKFPFMGSCSITDEECHKRCVETFFESYANGIPELDVPTMNPLYIGNASIKGNGNENANLDVHLVDLRIYNSTRVKCMGLKGFKKDVTAKMHLTMKIKTLEPVARTHCYLNGKLLIFNVNGEADLELHLRNISSIIKIDLEPYSKDKRIYLKATSWTTRHYIPNFKLLFSNSTLFRGDQLFTDVFTDTINDNWATVRDDIQPVLERYNSKAALNILNKILASIPYDEFFKNDEK